MLFEHTCNAIDGASGAALDGVAKAVWAAMAGKVITETEAGELSARIELRRATLRTGPAQTGPRRAWSYFPPRKPQGSPDRRRSRERRRELGGSGCMPNSLRAHFTEAQRAVLAIVAAEVKHTGRCARSVDEIAARAGCCRRTVQGAIRHAAQLGLLAVEERRVMRRPNLFNVITIVSREWRQWLSKGGGGCKALRPTEKKERIEAIDQSRPAHPPRPTPSGRAWRAGWKPRRE